MKKICYLLILILLLSCFAGCQNIQAPGPQDTPIENPDGTLSDQMKEEMLQWYTSIGGKAEDFFWADDHNGVGMRYYGTENGYVLFCPIGEPEGQDRWVTIAGYTFSGSFDFRLLAYKDGEIFSMPELYAQRIISADAIKAAWIKHNSFES